MMEEELSPEKDQERLINAVNELIVRSAQMEELIKELSSRAQTTDNTLASVSTDLIELSNEVTPLLAKPPPHEETLSSAQVDFTQSYLRDMMSSLGVPGMKFFGGKGSSRLHSYLWIFIHIVLLLISYVLIKEEYDNWNNSPVVKTISNNLTYANEIPFPAITVCLPGSISDDNDYAGVIEKCISRKPNGDFIFNKVCTYEEVASLAIASLVCPYEATNWTLSYQLFEQEVNKSIGGTDFSKYLQNAFPRGNVKIEQFRTNNGLYMYGEMWNGSYYLNFLSNLGMCFTMNGLKEKDIFKENTVFSYQKMSEHNNSPDYFGKDFTLENMLDFNGGFFTIPAYISENHHIEFSVLGRYSEASIAICGEGGSDPTVAYLALHNPVEVPFVFNSHFELYYGEVRELRVIPEMLITEKGLESYKPMERGCFYSYERELAMFKHYSENNCRTECAANCSLQFCGCVPYYLPRHNSSVRVCFEDCPDSVECDRRACGCLPDCYALSYDFEIVKIVNNAGEKGSVDMSYKTSGFYATVRVSLTNLAQFVAYCLGIIGVFNGFSFIMIFEIFYLFTLRLWVSLKSFLK